MKKSRLIYIFLILVGFVNLFPLWVIFKQAITPEKESLSWPPTFLPHELNLENIFMFFRTAEIIKATQTIYHDIEHPSHILLPVIP